MPANTMLKALLVSLTTTLTLLASGQDDIASKTKGLTPRPGLIDSYIDARQGKAYLKLPPPKGDSGEVGQYLYVESLATGLGSNELGLDRNQFGETDVLIVKVIGGKVLFEVPNLNFRATQGTAEEQAANKQNFAPSIIWAGPVTATDPDGSTLVDITSFLIRDAHRVQPALQASGGYQLDHDRSTLVPERCKAFPENLEFEALLTYQSSSPGALVQAIAAQSRAVTLTQHHSFVRLPDPGYKPRAFDPRCGCFSLAFMDFSVPLGQPLFRQWINRHRLEKTDPTAARSTVKKPIIYYVDRGIPEPIRTALITGGNYWRKSFEAAGFIDAYRVELMPEGADPLDLRYNVVTWLNRSTRGYAYGQSVVDPRTGEILKGAVNLDSQRVRQDITIFEGLLGLKNEGKGGPTDPIAVSLSRIRQLSAHEIGHTLGFQHNFAASTYGRASVMDYPAPLVRVTKGQIDASHAYAPGTGAWDDQLVRYAYTEFPSGANEAAGLKEILEDGIKKKLLFLSDEDTNDEAGAEARSNRWDNGNDPIANLKSSLQVRSLAMRKFGLANIRKGRPVADLELTLGPLYFYHRYDVDAVAKLVGGFHYVHAVNGDGQVPQWPVPAGEQRRAVSALLDCLAPEVIGLPASIAKLIGPRPNDSPYRTELFSSDTQYLFDSQAAARSAADLVLSRLLKPARCVRVLELSSRDSANLSLAELFAMLTKAIVYLPHGDPYANEIAWGTQHVFVTRLINLASDGAPTVRARARKALARVASFEQALAGQDATGNAAFLSHQIHQFLAQPFAPLAGVPKPPEAIPGAPIGD